MSRQRLVKAESLANDYHPGMYGSPQISHELSDKSI